LIPGAAGSIALGHKPAGYRIVRSAAPAGNKSPLKY
jgi:hypothetical protein